jgi:ankyrin repeat protein
MSGAENKPSTLNPQPQILNRYVGIVRALLDAGASAVAADQDGDTALHNAANGNHPQVTIPQI